MAELSERWHQTFGKGKDAEQAQEPVQHDKAEAEAKAPA